MVWVLGCFFSALFVIFQEGFVRKKQQPTPPRQPRQQEEEQK